MADKFIEWKNEKIGTQICPLCGHKDFSIDKEIHAVLLAKPSNETQSDKARLLIAVTCRNCAYVMFFSTKHMGIT